MDAAVGVQTQTLFWIPQCAARWGVSKDTVRRAADAGYIKTIYLGGRRLIPLSEVRRIEAEGFGTPRNRRKSLR